MGTIIVPFELVEDILRRLPVKSLKRFRAVSKSWCFLIDSEGFIKSHLRRSSITNSHRRLLLGGLGLYSVELDSLDTARPVKPPFYYRTVDGFSNQCNGVVLVMSDPPVMYNPFTRGYKALPNRAAGVDRQARPLNSYSRTVYGFGYDSRNDDYKVVRVLECRNEVTHGWMLSLCEIYSLKLNCWRRIDGFTYPLPFLDGYWRVHSFGALHTYVPDFDKDEGRIMGFSVETEKHCQMELPPGIRIREADVSLDVLDGSLSIVYRNKRNRIVIWVMKEYGVKESWIKLLTISTSSIEMKYFVKPLVYSRGGDKILLNCDDKRLVWFDLKRNTVDNVDVEGMPFMFYAEVCVESLVVLDDRDELKNWQKLKKKNKQKIRSKRDDFLSEGFKLAL